ncbi:MAG: efflux RND transporter periplasmic adaptor subunit [Patescibacteria group bacterium]|jgi:HlyD family secretion protein
MKARFWIIGLVVLVVIPTIVFGVWKPFAKQPVYELYSVKRGEVSSTVSVSGSVISGQSLELGFLSPGIIKTVAVKVGSVVKKGDLLVALNTDILNRQAAQAGASVTAARAMLARAQSPLRSADISVLDRGLDTARVALENARSQLQDAYRARDLEISNARVALENAQRAYQNALNSYSAGQGVISQSAEVARVSLSNAQTAFSNAQNYYNQVLSAYNLGHATLAELQQASSNLYSASSAYNIAQAQYQSALRGSDAERAGAKAQLDNARSALNSAQAAYNSAGSGADMKINSAQLAVNAAEASYSLASAQRSQSLAPALSADIQSAAAQVSASSAALQAIQVQIAQATLKAPIDGRVVTLNAKPAELSSMGQPVVVLETASEFKVEANISETELSKVRVGQEVKIKFDALPNVTADGTVATIDPAATIIMGVVNYKATILFNQSVADLFSSLTADLEIITDSRPDVLVVPRRSLIKEGDSYRVKVLQDNKAIEKNVEIGLLGDVDAEVIGGLTENEQVILKES